VKQTRGVKGAMFKAGESNQITCNIDNVDEISIAANLAGLVDAAQDISSLLPPASRESNMFANGSCIIVQKKGDQPVWISLTMSAFLVFIHRFGDSSLITLCRTNVNGQRYVDAIERSVVLLGKGNFYFLATP